MIDKYIKTDIYKIDAQYDKNICIKVEHLMDPRFGKHSRGGNLKKKDFKKKRKGTRVRPRKK